MDSAVVDQPAELAWAFNTIGVQPVICGGLAVYLLFRDSPEVVRATSDIDLMIPASQAREESRRRALAEVITGSLEYVVREEGKHFRFEKGSERQLDVLAPPVDGVPVEGDRVKFVRSMLHGRLTPEACFIEEDLRTVDLTGPLPDGQEMPTGKVCVPSPTNMLILKLFAFDDRDSDVRRDAARAQAHAYDIYVIAALAGRSDYEEGREFLARHEIAEVVQRARAVVAAKFGALEQSGWRHVLGSAVFLPGRTMAEKREALELPMRRLWRWFEGPGLSASD